jgi:predicted permease
VTDVTYSVRSLSRHRRYTLLAAVTLAAGIGVSVAMFGLLDAVFFRPLPIAAPDRLVTLRVEGPASRFGMLSHPEFLEIQRQTSAFEDLFAIGPRGVTMHHGDEPQLLRIHYVSGRYFPSLRIPLAAGRGFTGADDSPALQTPQAVINHHVWQQLGAPPDLVGRTIQLNSTAFTVIGITAAGFTGLDRTVRTDIWVTTAQAPLVVPGLRDELTDARHRWFTVMGRLAAGADGDTARAQLDVLTARWRAEDAAAFGDSRVMVRPLLAESREDAVQGAAFLALAGLVLLIACANVTSLALARGEGRRREVGVRAALGATRSRLVRQLLTESALLAAAGGALGLLLAAWILASVPALLPADSTGLVIDTRVDGRLLAFALAVTTLTVLLVGLLPAWKGSRGDISGAWKTDRQFPGWAGRSVSLRDLLVVGEIALSAVAIIAAALLVRSFFEGRAIRPGFDADKQVAAFYVVPGLKGYDRQRTYQFLEDARQRAAALPGVTRASYGIRIPAQGNEAGWAAAFTIPGKQPPAGKDAFEIRYTMVGPDYFAVMGTRVLRGRGITDADRPGAAPVAVISESMARQLWPREDPLGRHLTMGRRTPVEREIIGIAEDIRIGGIYESPEPYVYVPFAQHQQEFGLLLVESGTDASTLREPVKAMLASIDPAIPILSSTSFAQHMHLQLYEVRRNALVGLFTATLAAVLAAVGLFGLVSLVAARRTRELAVRVALGATRATLVRLLFWRGALLALAGGALGLMGGVAAGAVLAQQLRGVPPTDPWSIAAGIIGTGMVVIVANVIPAWRASRVDPVAALRGE